MASKRFRDKKYLRWLAEYGKCLICGTHHAISPHHLLQVPSEPNAMGLKAGDNWCVPLCHKHHVGDEGVHRHGNEKDFFGQHGIDPLIEAEAIFTFYRKHVDVR